MSIEDQQRDGGYDEGLAHCHEWARERMAGPARHPIVADAGRIATPSSVLHDDAHYAA